MKFERPRRNSHGTWVFTRTSKQITNRAANPLLAVVAFHLETGLSNWKRAGVSIRSWRFGDESFVRENVTGFETTDQLLTFFAAEKSRKF